MGTFYKIIVSQSHHHNFETNDWEGIVEIRSKKNWDYVISLHDPYISNIIVTHNKSSEAVCPLSTPIFALKENHEWIISPGSVILFFLFALLSFTIFILEHLSLNFYIYASPPRIISSMSYSPISHCGRLLSSCLWHNLVRARDLIWWNYLRTYDERETDGRKWQRQRLGYGTGGLPCQFFIKEWRSTRGWLGYLTKLKTEQSISHQWRKMTPLLPCVAQRSRWGIF